MKYTRAGFSLVEVMVAMTVFAIAASAVASLMFHSTETISNNNFSSQAIVCAQEELEIVRAKTYDSIENYERDCEGEGMSFEVIREVTENEPSEGLKTIVVTVIWTEKGESRSYAIETIYTEVTA
jgi:prepilin-type N-terminal cleavage/methylation domain-containing protein